MTDNEDFILRRLTMWADETTNAFSAGVVALIRAFDCFPTAMAKALTWQCDSGEVHWRLKPCDCPAPPPPKPVFLFHQQGEPVTVENKPKKPPANTFEAFSLSVEEANRAMVASLQSSLGFLETIRRTDPNEPPPYPEFFINH